MRCVMIRVRTRYKIFQKKKKRKRTFFSLREKMEVFFSLLVIELGSYAKQHREQKKKKAQNSVSLL